MVSGSAFRYHSHTALVVAALARSELARTVIELQLL
jgi:hypothetical protein